MVRKVNLVCTVAAAAIALGGPATAQSLPDKLCGISVAQRLPSIQGSSISVLAYKPLDKRTALASIIDRYRNLEVAAAELNKTFPFLDGRTSRKIENAISPVEQEAAKSDMVGQLSALVSDTVQVTAELQAAGMKIVYSGTCARGSDGAVMAVLDGAVR